MVDTNKLLSFSLQTLHTDDPLTWDYVARRELEIHSQPGEAQPATKQAKAVEMGRKEERCCAVYEEAVKTLPTGKLHQTEVWYTEVNVKLKFPFLRSESISEISLQRLQCACLSKLFFL